MDKNNFLTLDKGYIVYYPIFVILNAFREVFMKKFLTSIITLMVSLQISFAGGGRSIGKGDIEQNLKPPGYGINTGCVGCVEADHIQAVKVKNPECDLKRVTNKWRENCDKMFGWGSKVPKDALRYALNTMKHNDSSFGTNKCMGMAGSSHYSMRGTTRSAMNRKLSRGLPNKCEFIVNDTRKPYGGKKYGGKQFTGTMYYIDLCSGSKPKITTDYMNLGYGSFDHNFKDQGGKGTTTLGSFFTNYKTFDFSNKNADYAQTRSRVQKAGGGWKAPAVQLFGLQTTNNGASSSKKYMHVSPYTPSAGCPSVKAENYWMIERLAKYGPSLVVNYGHNMEDIQRCSK